MESGLLATTVLEILTEVVGEYDLDHLEVNVAEKRFPRHMRLKAEGMVIEYAWGASPLPKHLAFRGCLPPPPPTPAPHVRSLTLENDLADFTTILPLLPSLRFLDVSCGARLPTLETSTPLKTTTLELLEELRIHNVLTGHCAKLLDALHTPSLRRLTIGNFGSAELRALWAQHENMKWYDLMDVYGPAVSAFAEKTPTLETVHLLRSPIDDRHFVRVLQHLPAVRELCLDTLLIGLPALRGLTSTTGQTKEVLCPRLQHLRAKSCESIRLQHVVDLLKARNHAKAQCLPVLAVEIADCKDFMPQDESSLAQVDPQRLQISIL